MRGCDQLPDAEPAGIAFNRYTEVRTSVLSFIEYSTKVLSCYIIKCISRNARLASDEGPCNKAL
jgi:hypothetical protein